MKLETILENPFKEFNVKKETIGIKMVKVYYCMCPLCGKILKNKSVFISHIEKWHIKK